ncbi:hypothetical protein [Amycolatopsis thermoflava]|uniref:hypothetical protein n=1 Tax=Amycolatopsis thermoflava TaxID=84480 RepID=UPI003652ED1B
MTSADEPHDPRPTGEPAAETRTALDEVIAAIAGTREAIERLRNTWNAGMAQTLRQLDELRESSDQLVAQVGGNLDVLRRPMNH